MLSRAFGALHAYGVVVRRADVCERGQDPFAAYVGRQAAHWQKVKVLSDRVDMAIVGFGFQTTRDLSSTGDPHVSSFTVAVREAAGAATLVTVCEVPFFAGMSRAEADHAKRTYLQHGTVVRVAELKAALAGGGLVQEGGFVRVRQEEGYFSLWAQADGGSIVLRWVLHEGARRMHSHLLQLEDEVRVRMDAGFANVQAIAHPFLAAYSIAVYGDYRVNTGFAGVAKRFTSKYTVRFPRGTLRLASSKPPDECDTVEKLAQLAAHVREGRVETVLAADLRRAHVAVPTGMQQDAGVALVELGAVSLKGSMPRQTLSRLTLGFVSERDVREADDAALVAALKGVPHRWPLPLREALAHAAKTDALERHAEAPVLPAADAPAAAADGAAPGAGGPPGAWPQLQPWQPPQPPGPPRPPPPPERRRTAFAQAMRELHGAAAEFEQLATRMLVARQRLRAELPLVPLVL